MILKSNNIYETLCIEVMNQKKKNLLIHIHIAHLIVRKKPKRDLVSFKQLCRNRMFEFNAKQTRITRHTSAEKFWIAQLSEV